MRIRRLGITFAGAVIALAGIAQSQTPDNTIDRALVNSAFTWHSIADGGVRVFYQPGSFAERHRMMLLRSARAALAQGLAFLEMKPDSLELRVIYVNDRAQMEQLIGHTYSGIADSDGHGVLLVCNADWRSFDTHEITHILSLGRWGEPVEGSTWMTEGLPIAVDGWCQTDDVDHIASYLVSTGVWPGLSEFLAHGRSLGEIPAGILAGSLIRYLRQRYGARIIETAWRSGLDAALKARQADPKQVESDWLQTLKDLPNPLTDAEWEKLEAGCG
jgi:hypothetical protein